MTPTPEPGPATLSRRAALARLSLFVLAGAAIARPANAALLRTAAPKPFPHPEPRAGITSAGVLAREQLPEGRRARAAYEFAREYPEIFDGLYCACRCHRSHGHRSLLACFEGDQPAGCLGCQLEAELAGRLAAEGRDLVAVRAAVDEEWG